MCGNENGVGDGGVQRFRNAPETDYGFNWNPSQDVENDFVRQTLGRHHRLFHRLRHWFGYNVSKICVCFVAGKGETPHVWMLWPKLHLRLSNYHLLMGSNYILNFLKY